MSQNITNARPYSKAIFKHVMATGKLAQWSGILFMLAEMIKSPEVKEFISNPSSNSEQQVELLQAILPSETTAGEQETIKNFLNVLANNKRLLLLPEISHLYEEEKAEQEKTLEATVFSFSELCPTQQERLEKSLSQRLQRKVSLDIKVDPSLLGGVKILAGDMVIDGSVRGKLEKLRIALSV